MVRCTRCRGEGLLPEAIIHEPTCIKHDRFPLSGGLRWLAERSATHETATPESHENVSLFFSRGDYLIAVLIDS